MSVRRRARPDPLEAMDVPTWLVITDEVRRVMSFVEFPARTDLHLQLRDATDHVRAIGAIEDYDPRYSSFFFRVSAGARYCLHIQRGPPSNPLSSWVLPTASASLEDCFRRLLSAPSA